MCEIDCSIQWLPTREIVRIHAACDRYLKQRILVSSRVDQGGLQ